jgi:hypothetical protein
MVVVDASEFGAEGFDPKRWINAALDARHPSEPLDRFLADAEERLRAAADDAGAALERDSADALRRVPLACRDALRLRDDALALRSHLASVLHSLSQVGATPPHVVLFLVGSGSHAPPGTRYPEIEMNLEF